MSQTSPRLVIVPRLVTRRQMLGVLGAGAALGAPRRAAPRSRRASTRSKVGISGDPGTLHPWITNGMPQFSTFWPTIYESILWHDEKMALIPNLAEQLGRVGLRHQAHPAEGRDLPQREALRRRVGQVSPSSRSRRRRRKSLWKSMIAAGQVHHDPRPPDDHAAHGEAVPLRAHEPRHRRDDRARATPRRPARRARRSSRWGPAPTGSWSTVPGSHLIIERNDAYYGPKPKVGRMHFRWIAENGTRLSALESGEVHLVEQRAPRPDRPRRGQRAAAALQRGDHPHHLHGVPLRPTALHGQARAPGDQLRGGPGGDRQDAHARQGPAGHQPDRADDPRRRRQAAAVHLRSGQGPRPPEGRRAPRARRSASARRTGATSWTARWPRPSRATCRRSASRPRSRRRSGAPTSPSSSRATR